MQKKTVAVFFGGNSNEHEVSVITGMFAVNLLRNSSYKVVPVYLPRAGGMVTGDMRGVHDFRSGANRKFTPVILSDGALVHQTKKKRVAQIDVALNCCHGGAGEDGTLSALLAWSGIPNASPPTAVSAVFMDKTLTKHAARGLQIPVLEGVDVREKEWKGDSEGVLARVGALGYPVVVKPARLGSSIGVSVVHSKEELPAALSLAFRLDDGALLEKYLSGKRDLNCAACRIGGQTRVSEVEEAFSGEDILTFSEKYEGNARRSALPADIPAETAKKIQEYTRLLYESFHTRGVVRADFLLSEGELYFNELNTVPGSLSCYLFGETLLDARNFLVALVEEALSSPPKGKETLTTGILEEGVFSGSKGSKRR